MIILKGIDIMNQNGFSIPSQSTYPLYQNFIPQNTTNGMNNNLNNQNNSTEMTYAEGILRLNVGKFGNFYFSYSDSLEWRDRVFSGILESAGRDYILVFDQTTGKRFLLWTVYLNYAEFNEQLTINEM